jgi:hypothetical protein
VQGDEGVNEDVLLSRSRDGQGKDQPRAGRPEAQPIASGPRRGVTFQSAVNLTQILQI